MKNKYINIYNNLMILTRNKKIYLNNLINDNFSDRLIFFLLHFAIFLRVYKDNNDKSVLQDIFDFVFKQLESSFREKGFGDVTINKKMKNHINLFYDILNEIDLWSKSSKIKKIDILRKYINNNNNIDKLIEYFDSYFLYLSNKPLNFFVKSVNKHKF